VGSDSTPLLAVAVYEEALRDPLSALDPARLHHMTYRRLRREWLIDLQPLCHTPCHKIVTEVSRLLRPSLPTRQATSNDTQRVCRRMSARCPRSRAAGVARSWRRRSWAPGR
jgi:hypothetical protein